MPQTHEDASATDAPAELPRGARGYVVLLQRNANLRNVWIGQVISQLGDWFNTVALLGLLVDLTKNPASASLVLVIQILPATLTGLFLSGAIADRFDRRKIMLTMDLIRGCLALSFLFVKDPSMVWVAYAATAGMAIGGSFFNASSSAALPNLVTRQELPLANALSQSTFASMLMVGSAIGGITAHLFGRDVSFLLNSLSFFGSAFFVWRTKASFSTSEGRQVVFGVGTLRILTEGFRYLKQDQVTRVFILVKPAFSWIFGAIGLYSVYALNIYKVGDIGTSWLYIGRGLGALLSPLIVMSLVSLTDTRALGRVVRIGLFIAISGYAIFGFSTVPLVGVVGTFFGHFGAAMVWTFSRMILQVNTPDYVRGRVLALDEVMQSGVTSTANIVAGVVANAYFPEAGVLTVVSMGVVGVIIWLLTTWRTYQRTPTETAPEQPQPA